MKSGSRVFIKALIDSGNLFGDIMSERLANLLKIKYKPCTNKAGTAVANQKVHVLAIRDALETHEADLESRLTPTLILHLMWQIHQDALLQHKLGKNINNIRKKNILREDHFSLIEN